MVDFRRWLETVNGMSRSRRRGYGGVSSCLKSIGVPRANAYRWEGQLRGWYDGGPVGVGTLRRERATLLAEVARVRKSGCGRATLDRQAEWALVVEAAARLVRRVADTLAWRRADKTPVEWLAKASTGSLADEVELAILRVFGEAIRSSSYVECVNSRVRLVQVARKRMSEDFICLLAVHHNLKPFGRGSVREGWTPADLAGIQLPTDDWLELLAMTAQELGRPLVRAA